MTVTAPEAIVGNSGKEISPESARRAQRRAKAKARAAGLPEPVFVGLTLTTVQDASPELLAANGFPFGHEVSTLNGQMAEIRAADALKYGENGNGSRHAADVLAVAIVEAPGGVRPTPSDLESLPDDVVAELLIGAGGDLCAPEPEDDVDADPATARPSATERAARLALPEPPRVPDPLAAAYALNADDRVERVWYARGPNSGVEWEDQVAARVARRTEAKAFVLYLSRLPGSAGQPDADPGVWKSIERWVWLHSIKPRPADAEGINARKAFPEF